MNTTIVIIVIAVLAILVMSLLGIIIWVCLKKKKTAQNETVDENDYYYDGESAVYNNSKVTDKNDYYQHNL